MDRGYFFIVINRLLTVFPLQLHIVWYSLKWIMETKNCSNFRCSKQIPEGSKIAIRYGEMFFCCISCLVKNLEDRLSDLDGKRKKIRFRK